MFSWARTVCGHGSPVPTATATAPPVIRQPASNAGKRKTKREEILERVGGGAFNKDGSLKIFPLGAKSPPFNKEEFLRKAASVLKKKKQKKSSTSRGSCRPIDKSPKPPKPPDKDGGGGNGGPTVGGASHAHFSSVTQPVGAR